MGKLIIDGNSVYEIDEACQRKKDEQKNERKEEQGKKQNHNRHKF